MKVTVTVWEIVPRECKTVQTSNAERGKSMHFFTEGNCCFVSLLTRAAADELWKSLTPSWKLILVCMWEGSPSGTVTKKLKMDGDGKKRAKSEREKSKGRQVTESRLCARRQDARGASELWMSSVFAPAASFTPDVDFWMALSQPFSCRSLAAPDANAVVTLPSS